MAISACFGGIIFSILLVYECVCWDKTCSHLQLTTVSLTLCPSDMLLGVGLGCLVQLVKTDSNIQVILSSNTDQEFRILAKLTENRKKRTLLEHDAPLSPSPQFELQGLLTWILVGSLGLSLVLSFIIVPLCRFHLGRNYGIFLLLFYATFLVIALLTEFGKIHIIHT